MEKFFGDEVPEFVRKMPKSKRFAWHMERIRREEPAHEFLETIQTRLTDKQLEYSLVVIKAKIVELESKIKLIHSIEFKGLLAERDCYLTGIRRILSERCKLMTVKLSKGLTDYQSSELARLTDQQKIEMINAAKVEKRIISLCREFKADPAPFLKVEQVCMVSLSSLIDID